MIWNIISRKEEYLYRDVYTRFIEIDIHAIKVLTSCKTIDQCNNCFEWCLNMIRNLQQYSTNQYNNCSYKYKSLWQSLLLELDRSVFYYKIAYKLQIQSL